MCGRGSLGAGPVRLLSLAAAVLALAALAPADAGAAPPQVKEAWTEGVSTDAATLHATVDAGGLATTFRFEIVPEPTYLANLAARQEGFRGADRVPEPDGNAGKLLEVPVARQVSGLAPEASYLYRVVVVNAEGAADGAVRKLTTRGGSGPLVLPDRRGWEMVSPVDKNGGEIQGPGAIAGGGVVQASPDGEAITYSSISSFGLEAQGAPLASQYISRRGLAGWSTANVTGPTSAGAYGESPEGVPFQLFSPDLSRAVHFDGLHCGSGGCVRGYSLRQGSGALGFPAQEPDLRFAGASPDLNHLVLSTCAALLPEASEQAGTEGCDPADTNLYEWSGGGLSLVNASPGETLPAPFGRLAAGPGAVSEDGRRVYWYKPEDGPIWSDEGGRSAVALPETTGTAASFQAALADGAIAFYTVDGTLYRFDAVSGAAEPIAGGVSEVLGASADGSVLYFADAAGIERWQDGALTTAVAGAGVASAGDGPPGSGTARVSADGSRLLFLSSAELTPYDNTDVLTGEPDAEVYLYDAVAGTLSCVSCNPTGERPTGPASIPGAVANGTGAAATRVYQPRVLADGGRRVFFETPDSLVLQDTDRATDVYEWEAAGTGTCAQPSGCVDLISSGRSAGGARFLDAGADGRDVFFLTGESLVKADPGSVDLYDAREGGGFPEAETPIPCEEDACQPLPSPPDDPSPSSLLQTAGNPPVRTSQHPSCVRAKRGRHGHCPKKGHRRHRRSRRAGR